MKLLCALGFHKDKVFDLDGHPSPWRTIGKHYIRHCTRCGRQEIFLFNIERH